MCECAGACGDQNRTPSVFIPLCSASLPGQGLSLNLKLSWTTRELLGSTHLHPEIQPCPGFLCGCWGFEPRTSGLHSSRFSTLGHLPSPWFRWFPLKYKRLTHSTFATGETPRCKRYLSYSVGQVFGKWVLLCSVGWKSRLFFLVRNIL